MDDGIRPEHQRIGIFFGYYPRFAIGVDLSDLTGRQLFVVNLAGLAGHRLELQSELTK